MPIRFALLTFRVVLGFMKMTGRFLGSSERGFTGMEIALISTALSGGVFATAMINNGTLSADRLSDVVHRSLDSVSGSMEVRGAVIVTAKGAPLQPDTIQFSLGTFGTLQPIELDPSQPGGLTVSYRDANAVATNVPYAVRFGAASNGDDKLDDGELATISIKVSDLESIAGTKVLEPGKRWTVDLQTAAGVGFEFTRTQPSIISPVMAQP